MTCSLFTRTWQSGHNSVTTNSLYVAMDTTNSLQRVTTARSLRTCYNAVSTICPLQSTNSLQRWSLWIATTWSLRPGHNKCGYYNHVTTNSPQLGHYEFTTTPLQTRHNMVTTTRSLPPPGHYNLATTLLQHYPYNTIPTTLSLQLGHYKLTTMVILWQYYGHTLHHLTVLYNIFHVFSLLSNNKVPPHMYVASHTTVCAYTVYDQFEELTGSV